MFKGSGDGVSKLSNKLNRHAEGTFKQFFKATKTRYNHRVIRLYITYLVRFSMNASLIRVQYGGNTSKHLKNEWLSIHEIELFNSVLHGGCHQFIRLMSRVQLQ